MTSRASQGTVIYSLLFLGIATCNSIEETYAECVIEIKVLSKNDLMDLAKTENGLLNLCK